MREFTDGDGSGWTASVVEEEGPDYKGRFHLLLGASDGSTVLALREVRWNSERTARRTLTTMSVVELRRRLRAAWARSATTVAT